MNRPRHNLNREEDMGSRNTTLSMAHVPLAACIGAFVLAATLLPTGLLAEEPASPTTRVSIRDGQWHINCTVYDR